MIALKFIDFTKFGRHKKYGLLFTYRVISQAQSGNSECHQVEVNKQLLIRLPKARRRLLSASAITDS